MNGTGSITTFEWLRKMAPHSLQVQVISGNSSDADQSIVVMAQASSPGAAVEDDGGPRLAE